LPRSIWRGSAWSISWHLLATFRDGLSATLKFVSQQAPRIDRRLIRTLGRLDDPSRPIAETYRRACAVAAELGLVRPSYEQIRVLVHNERRLKEAGARQRDRLWKVYVGRLPPTAIFGGRHGE
jgi:hypothetical protein